MNVQALVKWLLARPHNAVLGLTVALLLPAHQLTSGAIMVLLILAQGTRNAVFEAGIAAAVMAVISALLRVPLTTVLELTAGTWVPATMLAMLLVRTRSLTLTLQVSVIGAVVVLLLFQLVVPDPTAFWQPYLDLMAELIRENGLQLDTTLLTAEVMTISAVLVFWMLYTGALLIGYSLYRRLPAETAEFGRFRDLSFGRVIAAAMALASLLAIVIDAAWLQNFAFTLFVMFMLQGLAVVHWLRRQGILPALAVVSVYVLLPILQVLLIIVLALIGYTDAWFGIRRRIEKSKGSNI